MTTTLNTKLQLTGMDHPIDFTNKLGKLYTLSAACDKGTAWAGTYAGLYEGDKVFLFRACVEEDYVFTLHFIAPNGNIVQLWLSAMVLFHRFVDLLTLEEKHEYKHLLTE